MYDPEDLQHSLSIRQTDDKWALVLLTFNHDIIGGYSTGITLSDIGRAYSGSVELSCLALGDVVGHVEEHLSGACMQFSD
jgi:hypothetical protein